MMDWLRQVPIGQYVAGNSSWLRNMDPRLKLAWVLMFLLTPVLAGSVWRVGLAIALLLMTFFSCLPRRTWSRSICLLMALAGFVGVLATLLPTGEASASLAVRSPQELSNVILDSPSWQILRLGPIELGPISIGPLIVDRRSAELGLKTSTLIFTVVHSVNLMLLTTPPEDLMWTIRWFIAPLSFFGVPIDRISFQLLLALRFLPLVQEEFQNLVRSVAIRAVNLRKLGFKAFVGLVLSVGERLLANILLRAEQGADALLARGGLWVSSDKFRPKTLWESRTFCLNFGSGLLLLLVLGLRSKYGAL